MIRTLIGVIFRAGLVLLAGFAIYKAAIRTSSQEQNVDDYTIFV
jgi:hypothetical protein